MITTDVVLLACVWTNALSILVIWALAKSFSAYLFFTITYGIAFSGTSTVTPVMVADYYGKQGGKRHSHELATKDTHPFIFLFMARSSPSVKCPWDRVWDLMCSPFMWIFDQWTDLGDDQTEVELPACDHVCWRHVCRLGVLRHTLDLTDEASPQDAYFGGGSNGKKGRTIGTTMSTAIGCVAAKKGTPDTVSHVVSQ